MLGSRGLGSCGCCCRKICVGHVSLSEPLQPGPLFKWSVKALSEWASSYFNRMSKNLNIHYLRGKPKAAHGLD